VSAAPVRDPRVRPFAGRPQRTLAFIALQAIADPGVVPCIVCGGVTDAHPHGVVCRACGSELRRDAAITSVAA